MRLICHECRAEVTITMEAPTCPACGVDLLQNLTPLEWVRGHYQEAAHLALQGQTEAALTVVEQGLAGTNATELHLLAAILHRKLGQWDGVRRHVAAIPVEDPLRPEGEWLIRAHQQEQRLLRQAQRDAATDRPVRVGRAVRQRSPEFYPTVTHVEPPLPPVRPLRLGRWLSAAVILLLFLGAFWQRDALVRGLVASLGVEDAPRLGAFPQGPGEDVVAREGVGDQAPLQAPATATPLPTPAPTNTPLPTATPPAPLVQTETGPPTLPPPVAANEGAALVEALTAVATQPFDLAAFLETAGRPDLAALDVTAVRREGRVILDGAVPFTADRLDILALVAAVEGEEKVDGVNLRVRLPETYTVQEGDTLWTIAYRLYGDPTRWQELMDANPELLANPAALAPGMQLRVPPL